MGFNGSGVFSSTTAGIPVVTGTTISSTVQNTWQTELDTGLTDCVTKDGQSTTTARIPFALGLNVGNGTVAAPAINFTNDTGCGLYRIGSADIGFAISGTKVWDIVAGSITLSQDLLFTDATYDIGKTGATRPRDLFMSRNLTVGGTTAITGHVTVEGVTTTGATGTGKFVFDGSPTLVTPTLGVFTATRGGFGAAADGTIPVLVTAAVANNDLVVFKSTGTTTGYNLINLVNTTGNAYFGMAGSTAAGVLTGGLAYATLVASNSSTALQLGTNGTARLTIDTSGNVDIGTTTANASGASRSLTIAGSAASAIQLTSNNGAAGGGALLQSSGGAGLTIFTHTGVIGSEAYTSVLAISAAGVISVQSGASLNIATGGSTTISTGVGVIHMSTANPATCAAWIPISYAGTVYYIPAWTTNAP